MGRVLEAAEALWRGERTTAELNPLHTVLGLEALQPGLAFVCTLANVIVVETADGLVLVDTGSPLAAVQVHSDVRGFSKRPLHTAIYTHGHVDHVFGVAPFEVEPGAARARVVAHEAVAARFDRYKLTAGWNGRINARQFSVPVAWPTEYRYPDRTYRDRLTLEVGGERLELVHARGETDDHTYVWLPDRRVLCTGDLFIWAAPNCGNPQKVQRYPREWARALEAMVGLGAEILCPGHGPPIVGAQRVRQALEETAALLSGLHDRTLALMNEGATLDRVLAEVTAPAELLARPYLRPVYDDPQFIVRNVWRLYGGWWDGDPAQLKPAPKAAVAREVAALAGGAGALAARAEVLLEGGELALACHLIELAHAAAPGDAAVSALRRRVYEARAQAEPSLMAKGIYRAATRE